MRLFGTTDYGTEVHEIALRSGRIDAKIVTLGARLNFLSFAGSPNLVPSAADVSDALGRHLNSGPVIGPVINRLRDGQARLDSRTLELDTAPGKPHLLHSGPAGTQRKVWRVADRSETSVLLSIDLPDGEGGFPGNRVLTARYRVDDDALTLDLTAATDAPTLINLGHHGYWTMDGSDDWSGHALRVDADHYLPVDDATLPTGEIAPVDGTRFDLRTARTPSSDIDNNFCLPLGPRSMRSVARLTGPSGRSLEVITDAAGLQVYTGKPHVIALEPQGWPDAPNHPAFPSIRLDAGDRFSQSTRYVFSGI